MPRWVRVARVDALPVGSATSAEVDGIALALYRTDDGRCFASSGACPHEDGPLGEGTLEGARIVCPWHGFDFDVRTGACAIDPRLSLACYPVRVEGGHLLVELE